MIRRRTNGERKQQRNTIFDGGGGMMRITVDANIIIDLIFLCINFRQCCSKIARHLVTPLHPVIFRHFSGFFTVRMMTNTDG